MEPARAGTVLVLPAIMAESASAAFTVHAGEVTASVARCLVELTIDSRPGVMAVPVVFANGNLRPVDAIPSGPGSSPV